MREHMGLFRGKRIDNGEWVEGCYYYEKVGDYFTAVFIIEYLTDGVCEHHRVIPDTVGECTGLRDKNGKLIFEGDIIRFAETPLVVFWNDEAFGWYAKKCGGNPFMQYFWGCEDWDYIDLGWIAAEVACIGKMTTEIIGNITDNPELLKGGEG